MKNLLIPVVSVIAVGTIIAAIGILLVISGFGKPKTSPLPNTFFYEERNIPASTTAPSEMRYVP